MLKTADMVARSDIQLGPLSVSPARRIVSGPAGQASLEPRIMQVLMLLLDARGAVVTRSQIFDECWGGLMVGDDSINRAIGRLRKVFADVAPQTFEIETIPRTGYRLVPHEAVAQASPSVGHPSAPTESLPAGRVSRRLVLGVGLAGAAAGAALWLRSAAAPDPADALIADSRTAMRSGTPAGEQRAVQLLERAVATAPDNAQAWGVLALTLARIGEHGTSAPPTPPTRILEAANRATALDKGNADAKAAVAVAIPYYGDWLAAERRFDSILQAHPDHLYTRDSRAFLLGAVGRMKESAHDRLSFSREAWFEPDLQNRTIYALWFLDRIGEADRVANRAMEMWPGHAGIWFARLWVLSGTGRLDRALAHVDHQGARPKLPPPMVATLRVAISAAQSRDPTQVAAAVERVMASVGQSIAAVVNAMMLLNLMGATDSAFDLADAYYLERGPIIAAMQWRPGQPAVPDQRRRKTNMLFTPAAAAMQRDPRFLPLVREMGLVDYWGRRGVVPDFLAGTAR